MIEYFEMPELSLTIEKHSGNIDLEQLYDFAHKYLIEKPINKFKYTIIDLRESVSLINHEEFKEFFNSIVTKIELNIDKKVIYLAHKPDITVLSIFHSKESLKNFDNLEANIFSTLEAGLRSLNLSAREKEITKYIKSDYEISLQESS